MKIIISNECQKLTIFYITILNGVFKHSLVKRNNVTYCHNYMGDGVWLGSFLRSHSKVADLQ